MSKQKEIIDKELFKEKLTNTYMIQLSLGILGILALMVMRAMYRSLSTLLYMQTITAVLTVVFAVGAVALFVLGKSGKIKNSTRATHYSIFLIICAAFSLWLSLYNALRPIIESAARVILNNPALTVSSYWNIRIPVIAIVAYLVIAFIVYVIRLYKD